MPLFDAGIEEKRASRPLQEFLNALESENAPIDPDQKPKAMSPSADFWYWLQAGVTPSPIVFRFAFNIRHQNGDVGFRRIYVRSWMQSGR